MLSRHSQNPLITPAVVKPSRPGYRVRGAFNPAAIEYNGEILLLLRVAEDCHAEEGYLTFPFYRFEGEIGHPEILQVRIDDPSLLIKSPRSTIWRGREYLSTLSHLRLARSWDGIHFLVDEKPFLFPSNESESYGVEDARITKIKEDYWINYTAVSRDSYATALARTHDFSQADRKGIIFPVPNKDVCIFPEKVGGRYAALHRPYNHDFGLSSIWYAESNDLVHWGNHKCILRPRPTVWENRKIGGGAPPIKTPEGWLEIYHGTGLQQGEEVYTLFVALLDLHEPWIVRKQCELPILFPLLPYEKEGFVPNVVFTNGIVAKPDGTILIYYGACDEFTCLAQTHTSSLLGLL